MDGKGFVYVHPMKSNSKSGEALNVATRYIIVPTNLISENEREHKVPHTEL